MQLEQIETLLLRAAALTNHRHFVIVGSLSVLGAVLTPPPRMVASIDIDLYLKFDPERIDEINFQLGEFSEFARTHGFFADALSPRVLSLPSGFEARLLQVPLQGGISAWFLDPSDAAAAKLIRCAANDLEWVAAGLAFGLLRKPIIHSRLKEIERLINGERVRALAALDAL